MKKLILFLLFLVPAINVFSNAAPMSSAYVSELYFDADGNWTIELYFKYYDAELDTGYVMITSTDTAFFNKFPDSTNIVLLTCDDLSKPVVLDKTGDMVRFENWSYDIGMELTWEFMFGDFPGSMVNAPYAGQSLVSVFDKVVKDTAASLGFLREPPKGIMRGHIYDSVGNPLPYIRVQTYGIEARTLWPDENGFFTDTLYAKNYTIFIYNQNPNKIYGGGFAVEPDSVTIHDITLPVSAEMQLSGYSYLVGSENHSYTKVYLTPQCPFAPADTIVTDSTGYYSKTIPIGHYYLRYSHENYLPFYTNVPVDMFFDYQMYDTYLEEGIVNEITDSVVSGRWTADHPYWIFTNLNIAENDTLIIDPGVQINFKRNYHWNVFGTLLAEGTSADSIFITKTIGNWGPLNFQSETSGGSLIKYADLSFPKSINFYNSNATVQKSRITWNGDLCFFGTASPIIDGCLFDYGVALNCYNSSSPLIVRNKIHTAIFCNDSSTPKIYYNDFYSFWVAIGCAENGRPDIIGNVFQQGGIALDIRHGSAPTIMEHNILYDLSDPPIWTYDEWIPGFGELDTTNINGDTCDMYFNLFMDPMMTDPENGDFSLMPGSPCIDAGNPGFPLDPDTTISDIGAHYFDQSGVYIHSNNFHKPEIKLFHYPNPAADYVNFVVEGDGLNHLKNAYIRIYDLTGKKVGELLCPSVNVGFEKKIYRYELDNLNSVGTGTLLYSFEADGKVLSTNKMILLK